jgi:replication factor C large subunit
MEWAEKYRPAHLADIVGNKTAVLQIAEWAKNWTSKSRPLLIYGKPGIGKTSTALALANDMGWEVVELNASATDGCGYRTGSRRGECHGQPDRLLTKTHRP